MSRHHITPAAVYTPPPPKKIEKKRSTTIGRFGELNGTEEARETSSTARPMQIASKQNFPEIEGAERKPRQPSGRLSQSTLSVLLRVQEM